MVVLYVAIIVSLSWPQLDPANYLRMFSFFLLLLVTLFMCFVKLSFVEKVSPKSFGFYSIAMSFPYILVGLAWYGVELLFISLVISAVVVLSKSLSNRTS